MPAGSIFEKSFSFNERNDEMVKPLGVMYDDVVSGFDLRRGQCLTAFSVSTGDGLQRL
ncbi:MAG: hypothetical protein KGJ59_11005 [Bacteroidota bacterium]|nr:hypothetical protein [Bacteroidota bacterium]